MSQAPPTHSLDKKEQLKFAERCFVNAQELNRLMDQKSGFIVAAIGILSASIAALGKDLILATTYSGTQLYLQTAGGCLSILYFALAFATVYSAGQVFQASKHALKSSSHSPGLIFPLIILNRFNRDVKEYSSRLAAASMEELLIDYASQIMELSLIYERKQARVNEAIGMFRRLVFVWFVAMVVLIATPLIRR